MLFEVVWHGRGGQGAVTAANLLAKAAFLEGKYASSFPFFGAERRGAPVKAFTRLSDRQILIHSEIYRADCAVVLDESVLKLVDVEGGLKEKGILIVNTSKEAKELNVKRKDLTVAVVNATAISVDLGLIVAGFPVVNTPMIGAFSRVTGLVKIESVEKAIIDTFTSSLGLEKARANALAAKKAYEQVVIYKPR